MSLPPDLDRRLSAFLADEMSITAPEGLLSGVLAAAGRTRRRPAWRTPERWFPMALTFRLAVVPRALVLLLLLVLIISLAFGGALIAGNLRAVSPAPLPGAARNGLIAFDAAGDIWVVEPDGSDLRQLTTGPALEHGPAWSRDGTRIAYWSQETQGGPSSLIVANTDGSNPLTVATDDAGRTPFQFLDWSPDGRHVTYSLATVRGLSLDERVYVAATDGSGAHQVGDPELTARQPSWSPDGSLIAFTGSVTEGAIEDIRYPEQGVYLMNADGTDVRRLSKTDSEAGFEFYRVEWSPDGTRIATDIGGAIMGITADGTSEAVIGSPFGDAMIPRWSPDGETILFTRLDSSRLNTMPSSGGDGTT